MAVEEPRLWAAALLTESLLEITPEPVSIPTLVGRRVLGMCRPNAEAALSLSAPSTHPLSLRQTALASERRKACVRFQSMDPDHSWGQGSWGSPNGAHASFLLDSQRPPCHIYLNLLSCGGLGSQQENSYLQRNLLTGNPVSPLFPLS